MAMDINTQILNNINSLIFQRYTVGVKELSTEKIINFIERRYRIRLDPETLNGLLSSNPHVDSVTDKKIILKAAESNDSDSNFDEESQVDKEVHDMALDQIDDHIKEESFDILSSVKKGDKIKSRLVQLDEDNYFYHLHKGAVKSNSTYIVEDIVPSIKLEESVVRCRIDLSNLTIDLPVACFKKIK